MIVKFNKDYVIKSKEYQEGDVTQINNDTGRRLVKLDVATVISEPDENMAINQDWVENRSQFYE